MKKPCLVCGVPTTGSRCKAHRLPRPTHQENRRRATAVAQHREQFGNLCPGYLRSAHTTTPDNPLTADHIHPRSKHGDHGPLQVLCLECNSRRHDRATADYRTTTIT